METKIRGDEPNLYASNMFENFDREVYVNEYLLYTADSFERGHAYSLHLNNDSATNYRTDNWWKRASGPSQAFVKESTLEKINNCEDKVFFWSEEN